jgi:hypothetical protein
VMRAPLPADEPARLAALRDAQVLDTPPEDDFDDIALLASEICGTPMGLVSLVDEKRQWFKAKVGVNIEETNRELSFCAHAIHGHDVFEVPDATTDVRFADNPMVLAERTPIRFYAGAPVVLDKLLQVAKQSDDVERLDVAELDLADLTHQVITGCRPLAEHKGISLVDRTERPSPARGDGRRLSQALNHLVVNAIKFTAPGGEITVDSNTDSEPQLIITDTGVGIDADDLPHIFDRFFRSSSADVMAVQGPGLGLAVVKSIIEAHHGSVRLESEPDVGTTVRLILPRS